MVSHKDVDEFRKRLAANASVISQTSAPKKRACDDQVANAKAKRLKLDISNSISNGESKNTFSLLTKIVNHMRDRHRSGQTHHLNLEEILQELKMEVSPNIKKWLDTEALQNNVKIDVVQGNYYLYKPELKIRGINGLKKILETQFSDEIGAISLESLEESIPNCARVLESIKDSVVIINRPDKKGFVFKKVIGAPTPIKDESFLQFWRTTSLEGMTDGKIEEVLRKNDIHCFASSSNQAKVPVKTNKPRRASKKNKELKHNSHIAEYIINYQDK